MPTPSAGLTGLTPRRTRWLLALAVAAVLGAGAWVVYAQTSKTPPGPRWLTATLDRGSITTAVSATGTVEPVRVVEVGAEISGRVVEVTVEADAWVEAGALLARLDPEPLQAKLEQAQAQLAIADASNGQVAATVVETRQAEARASQMARKGLISQEERESAIAARARAAALQKQAEAQRQLAEAQLRQVQADLDKAAIHTPIAGVVLTRDVEPGQSVAASLQTPILFTIAQDLRQMQLLLAIDEADVGSVSAGMAATFTVDAHPRKVFEAQVKALRYSPRVEQNVVTYQAVLTVANPDLLLRPGMTATAQITASEVKGALRVPNAALRFSPPVVQADPSASAVLTGMGPRRGPRGGRNKGGPRVWVLKDGTPTPVTVVPGATDGRFTELQEAGDLLEGAEVLIGSEKVGP